MFISRSDLQAYCPNDDQNTLQSVISDVELLFCGLLPLDIQDREVSFYDDEVYLMNWWKKVNTTLLNINSLKIWNDVITDIKILGKNKSELFFKYDKVEFDPVFTMSINSWYDKTNLPWDIRQAMIDYARDQVLLLGNPSETTSISMWPRKLTFSWEWSKNTIMQVLYKYLI